jgi:hypothetical protein
LPTSSLLTKTYIHRQRKLDNLPPLFYAPSPIAGKAIGNAKSRRSARQPNLKITQRGTTSDGVNLLNFSQVYGLPHVFIQAVDFILPSLPEIEQ